MSSDTCPSCHSDDRDVRFHRHTPPCGHAAWREDHDAETLANLRTKLEPHENLNVEVCPNDDFHDHCGVCGGSRTPEGRRHRHDNPVLHSDWQIHEVTDTAAAILCGDSCHGTPSEDTHTTLDNCMDWIFEHYGETFRRLADTPSEDTPNASDKALEHSVPCPRCNGDGGEPGGGHCSVCRGLGTIPAPTQEHTEDSGRMSEERLAELDAARRGDSLTTERAPLTTATPDEYINAIVAERAEVESLTDQRDAWREYCEAKDALLVAYRMQSPPTEKALRRLDKAREALADMPETTWGGVGYTTLMDAAGEVYRSVSVDTDEGRSE